MFPTLQANQAVPDNAGQHALPVRKYLDSTVVPVLLQGMNKLAAERCARFVSVSNPCTPTRCLLQAS